jgi:hypothetical protein
MPLFFLFLAIIQMSKKVIFVFILGIFCLTGCQKTQECEKEIYLIKEGFKGNIIVFFNQEDGQEIQYEDSARLYRIPELGYLKSQFPPNGGCMGDNRIQFFYEDSLGQRQSLDYFLNIDKEDIPTDRDFVMFSFLSDKSKKPDFIIHCVGHVSEFNELTESVKYLKPDEILEAL